MQGSQGLPGARGNPVSSAGPPVPESWQMSAFELQGFLVFCCFRVNREHQDHRVQKGTKVKG